MIQKTPLTPLLRMAALAMALSLAACTGLDLPGPQDLTRSGKAEQFVKLHHSALTHELAAGHGPTLEAAFDLAGVPPEDRPARRQQLSRNLLLYARAPGALSSALIVYGR